MTYNAPDYSQQSSSSWRVQSQVNAASTAPAGHNVWQVPLTRRSFVAASALAASVFLAGTPGVSGVFGAPGASDFGAQTAWADDPDNNVGEKLSDYIIRLRPKGFLRTVSVHGDGTVVGQVCWLYQQGTSSKHHLSWHSDLGGYSIHTMSNFEEKKLSSYNVWSVDGDSKDEGKAIHVWSGDYDEKASRVFKFRRQDDGTYLIKNVNSGRYLSLENVNNDTNENKLVQRGEAMAWEVEVVGVGVGVERYPSSDLCRACSSFPFGTEWMGFVDGNKLLSEISLPGTHDSGALSIDNDTEPQTSMAKCQQDYIPTQLNLGVRYLDIRLGTGNDPGVNHGGMYAMRKDGNDLHFSDVVEYCRSFVAHNPSETVVMLISNSGGSDEKITDALASYMQYDLQPFWDEARIPTLGEVRGKIVLLRRFTPSGTHASDHTYGIDLHDWDSKIEASSAEGLVKIYDQVMKGETNDPEFYTTVYAQDTYGVSADDKPSHVDTALQEASELSSARTIQITVDDKTEERTIPEYHYVINYTSSSKFIHSYSNPFYAAQSMNEHLFKSSYFCKPSDSSTDHSNDFIGIIPSDFSDAVLATNVFRRDLPDGKIPDLSELCHVPTTITLVYGDDLMSAQFTGGGLSGDDYYKLVDSSAVLDVAHSGNEYEIVYVEVDPFGPEHETSVRAMVPITVLPRPVSLVWEGIDNLVSAADVRSKVVAKLLNVVDGDDLSAQLEFCYDNAGAPGAVVDTSKLGALGEGTYWVRAVGLLGDQAENYELVDDGRISFTVSRAVVVGEGGAIADTGTTGAANSGTKAGTPLAPTGDSASAVGMVAGVTAVVAAGVAAGAYAYEAAEVC